MKGKINHIWGAVVLSGDHEKYRIKNADYNAVIKAGQTVTFGMQIEYEGDAFSGIRDVLLYDSQWKRETVMPTTSPVVTSQPATSQPTTTQPTTSQPTTTQPATSQPATSQPTNLPTDAPKETTTPENTVVPTKVPQVETEEIEEGDACFFPVENRDWNMDMIRAKDSKVKKAKANPNRKIKVTMLDSGINYSSEVEVKERKNFLGEYEEMNCLYEDESGHGTAIAEILASNPEKAKEEKKDSNVVETEQGTYTYYDQEEEENLPEETMQSNLEEGDATLMDLLDSGYEWNEGVNPSIELYSGKILDENNETTVDLVVEGIDWAIEKESDILCLSIGMEKGSEKLHEAVKRAKKAGILIVSAVGEGDKADYPAAYPEVLSVGMTDSMGCYLSAPAEVATPGDGVISRGFFDSMQMFSGSSMAVPQVAGLASILWQQHPEKDATFIRGLIDISANKTEKMENCEYGLIDCSYALESFEAFEKQIEETPELLKKFSKEGTAEEVKEAVDGVENVTTVETEEEIQKLHGNWEKNKHMEVVSKKYKNLWKNGEKYAKTLRRGLSFVDRLDKNPDCYGMREHPWFHGFMGGVSQGKGSKEKTVKSNYMTSVRGLVELADNVRMTGKVKILQTDSESAPVKNAIQGINKAFATEG
ncbi:MAG: S8 family serine peptidase, partial [Eubacterium sp.]|nr:S8 family serine peptidase [Eubacterium sp.]